MGSSNLLGTPDAIQGSNKLRLAGNRDPCSSASVQRSSVRGDSTARIQTSPGQLRTEGQDPEHPQRSIKVRGLRPWTVGPAYSRQNLVGRDMWCLLALPPLPSPELECSDDQFMTFLFPRSILREDRNRWGGGVHQGQEIGVVSETPSQGAPSQQPGQTIRRMPSTSHGEGRAPCSMEPRPRMAAQGQRTETCKGHTVKATMDSLSVTG